MNTRHPLFLVIGVPAVLALLLLGVLLLLSGRAPEGLAADLLLVCSGATTLLCGAALLWEVEGEEPTAA